jgi:hypothetical protein
MFHHTKNGREHRREHGADNRDERRSEKSTEQKGDRKGGSRGSAIDAVRLAKRHLMELTGRMPETVSSVNRTRGGGWVVRLEIVELERIPQSTDILASYQVELDENGGLASYERVSRYFRNQASSEE